MVEAERLESEKQIHNGIDKKRKTWGKEDWQRLSEMMWSIARMELGETSEKINAAGRRKTWWWNQEVEKKLKDKRKSKKEWNAMRDDASKLAYKTATK